jgi:protein required for attachment to host cells
MSQVWVVVASSTRCRIFSQDKHSSPLVEIEDLVHPEGRLRPSQLESDRPGRAFDSSGHGRHAMGQPASRATHECARFAKSVASRLESARHRHRFDRLVVVAEPRFLGHLRQGLSEATRSCVTAQVKKNLCTADAKSIREALPYRI